MGQLSFWSADARPRALGDLEGLLCGPGRAELFGRGSLARLIVVLGPPPEPEPEENEDDEEDADAEKPGPSTSVGATLTSNVRIATSSPARHAEAGDGADEDDDQAPDVDLDDLAFLDLDPDEMAARLGLTPTTPAPGPEPLDRDGGFPDVERQHGPHAGTDPPDPALTWRAQAVACALRARGVPAEIARTEDGRPEVRTAFRADLVDLARAWSAGDGMKKVPAEFELDGPRLRLWVLAAGWHDGRAYSLGLDPEDRGTDGDLLTASRHLGLGASLHLPALRIVGARRQRRLGELVGRPPGDLIDGVWPV